MQNVLGMVKIILRLLEAVMGGLWQLGLWKLQLLGLLKGSNSRSLQTSKQCNPTPVCRF